MFNSFHSHRLSLLLLLCIGMLGCSTIQHHSGIPNQEDAQYVTGGIATGAVIGAKTSLGNPVGVALGGLLGGYLNSEGKIISKLQARGVQVIQIGDTTSLLIPSDRYFEPADDLMEDDDYPTLDLIVSLLNKYGNCAIKIAVGMDNVDSAKRDRRLGKRQAERISSYLWSRGISAWRLYPISYGSRQRLATNRTVMGSNANRVIEITFNPYVTPADCCSHIHHFMAHKQPWQFQGLPY